MKQIRYKNITFCCQDCGTKIHYDTALWGNGRCRQCFGLSERGKNHPCFGKFGKNHPSFKNGFPNCIVCGQQLKRRDAKKCKKCYTSNLKGKNNPNFNNHNLKGKNNPFFGKHHTKETKLKISKKKIGQLTGKKHPNYIHGNGYSPYPIMFNDRLKLKIRQRDNFICKNCKITEEKHKSKFNRILNIHHIDYNKQNCKDDNLITLCDKCNIKANYNRDYWYSYYTYLINILS